MNPERVYGSYTLIAIVGVSDPNFGLISSLRRWFRERFFRFLFFLGFVGLSFKRGFGFFEGALGFYQAV